MRHGFSSSEHQAKARHPISIVQNNKLEKEWVSKLDMVRRTYGSHLAMVLESERIAHSASNRLYGLESSNISLQIVTGSESKINMDEYLNGSFFKKNYIFIYRIFI
jgi:hypothetical protein